MKPIYQLYPSEIGAKGKAYLALRRCRAEDVDETLQRGREELLGQLQEYFQARREIAVDVQVRAPETVPVNVAVRVKAQESQDQKAVEQRVEQALRNWFTGKILGQSVLLAKLGSLIYGCEGVENYAISAPTADVAAAAHVLPVLGTLTVEELA